MRLRKKRNSKAPILGRDWNELVDAMNPLVMITGGPGIKIANLPGGLTISSDEVGDDEKAEVSFIYLEGHRALYVDGQLVPYAWEYYGTVCEKRSSRYGSWIVGFGPYIEHAYNLAESHQFSLADRYTPAPKPIATPQVVLATPVRFAIEGEAYTEWWFSHPNHPLINAETPSGTIDGTNDEFTISFCPIGHTIQLFKNGLYMERNRDYEIDGVIITYDAGQIPQAGDNHYVHYTLMLWPYDCPYPDF